MNETIVYGMGQSPFGLCQVATAPHGICFLGFADQLETAVARLAVLAGRRALVRDDGKAGELAEMAFGLEGAAPELELFGTPFQLLVWETLRRLPMGVTVSYRQLARLCGRATAVRATANAVAANPVAWLVPCHRVIRADGGLGGYRWGVGRKQALLDYERRLLEMKNPLPSEKDSVAKRDHQAEAGNDQKPGNHQTQSQSAEFFQFHISTPFDWV